MSLRLAPLLTVLLILGACGGGGSEGVDTFTGNLKAVSFRVSHPRPTAAHEVAVFTTIEATDDIDAVPVSYFLLDKQQVDAGNDEAEQHVIDEAVFRNVRVGVEEYATVVKIPAAIPFPSSDAQREWYLIPQVDAADAIQETNEDDNLPTSGDRIVVTLFNRNTTEADIVIENVEIDSQDAIVLDPTATSYPPTPGPNGTVSDQPDHDFGATLTISTTGANDAEDCDLSATIAVPGEGELPLRFWDPEQSQYVNQVFTTITPGIVNTIHCDMHFPGGTRREIDTYLRTGAGNEFTVTFSSNMTANLAEWENGVRRLNDDRGDDNRFQATIVIVLPPLPPARKIQWDVGYKKDWSNAIFSVGLDLGGGASLDERGAIARAHAKVPVRLFGLSSDAIDASAFGRVLPRENQPTDSEFSLAVRVFGETLWSRQEEDVNFTYQDDQSITKTYEHRGLVFVGPVPVDVRASASGTMGFRTDVFLDPARLNVQVTPYAEASAFASASVNVIVARFGAEGTMTIIKDCLDVGGEVFLSPPRNNQLTGNVNLSVTNELVGPTGRLYLFVEYPVIQWCAVIFPCGFRQQRDEHTLVRFRTFRKTDVLYNDSRSATVDL